MESVGRAVTTDLVVRQLTNERDHIVRQIAARKKEIDRFGERLEHKLMPNQISLLRAQRKRQVAMLEADQDRLVDLEKALAVEIGS